ncbi:Rv2175c family DNA-binding protein [Kineococcus indalonis]|uniref:Rv2175c family DNA-binding protein n=1 Tax=Kineococcus indalonis TaxID=2696566 RepID=UPI002B1BDFB1|nr:Rv2175c family DNA-binding protein [Kineococcus indalonis]NAZ86705.1 DNA-binding protein [Kineococcus indalonis]
MVAPLRAEIAREQGDELDALVPEWLTVPDAAQVAGVDLRTVRRWLQERELLAVRRGERSVASIPAAFVTAEGPLNHLRGTLSVLADSRYSDVETIRWLFTPDDTLPGTPIDALKANRKTEVRRRAQALSF